jgi:hypothetical protein
MDYLKNISLVLVFILCVSFGLLHHGWANYDQENVLDYTGSILENDIGNPHTYIDLEVPGYEDEDAKVWNVVLAPLTRMSNRGLTDHEMLDVCDTVRVVGYPNRTIEDEMRAERIHIGDVTIELR